MSWEKLGVVLCAVTLIMGVPLATGAADDPPAMCEPVTLDSLAPDETSAQDEPGAEDTGDAHADDADDGAPADDTLSPSADGPGEPPPVDDEEPPAEPCMPFVYDMASPVAGQPTIISGFAQPRPNHRLHKGADVAGPKLSPVYAVASGTVSWMGSECCSVAIRHLDGWTSYYIHLNNDSYATDDGLGKGLAPGIALGEPITEGQLIGWIGDSGNAEETVPHIHFELRMPDGRSIDAVPSLQAARVHTESDPLEGRRMPYADDDGHPFEHLFGELTAYALLTGCGSPVGTAICPDEPLTGADAVAITRTMAGLEVDPAAFLSYDVRPVDPLSTTGPDLRRCGVYYFCPEEPSTPDEARSIARHIAGALAERAAAEAAEARDEVATTAEQADVPLEIDEPAVDLEAFRLAEPALQTFFECSVDTSWLVAPSTRGEFIAYLAELLGYVEVVPCGNFD